MCKVRAYSVADEYNGIGVNAPTRKETAVARKISLLRDFDILKPMDSREDTVRKILMKCPDEHKMTQVLHDVLRETETLDQLIARWRN